MKAIFKYTLLIGILLAPFETLRFFKINITISDVLLIMAGMFLLVCKTSSNYEKDIHSRNPIWNIWMLAVALIVAGFLLSEIFSYKQGSEYIVESLQYMFSLIYIPFLLTFLDLNEKQKAAKAFIMGLFIMIIVGLTIWLFFRPLYIKLAGKEIVTGHDRVGSFMGVNGLPKTIAATIPLLFLLYVLNVIKRINIGVILALYGIGTIMAASYGGTISVLCSLFLIIVFLTVFKFKETVKNILVISVCIFIIIMALSIFNVMGWQKTFQYRVFEPLKEREVTKYGSYLIKIDLMKEALNYIKKEPFIGIGAGRYKEISIYATQVHNSFLLTWVEGGLIALLGIVMIFLTCIIYSMNIMLKTNKKVEGAILLSIVLVLMLNAVTSTELYPRYYFMPLIIGISIVESLSEGDNRD